MCPKESWGTVVKSPQSVMSQGAIALGVCERLLKETFHLESFACGGEKAPDWAPGSIFITDDPTILYFMQVWKKRSRQGTLPNLYRGQLNDLSGLIFVLANRRLTPASMRKCMCLKLKIMISVAKSRWIKFEKPWWIWRRVFIPKPKHDKLQI